ncbi:hydrogen gas-evolving membrane-bound hydrogenase subunit E [Aquipuribacter nitratireducens]|uniref:Hydrogen gas-evolving membrane-bound hydrogenase subunit E n=1 Tax=Aquipuribacter nitratireducens TaxID=650104 RepID=A0ABW0GRQ4_9MICO
MAWLLATHVAVAVVCAVLAPVLRQRVLLVAALAPVTALGWLLTQVPAVLAGRGPAEEVPWAPTLDLALPLRLDGLSLVLALVVTGVGTLVLVYAVGYFAGRERGLGRIAALLVLFGAGMLLLVLADHVLALYVGWELTTVCSFLLIGDAGADREHRRAATRALLVTAGPGLGMLLGLLVLAERAGTYRLSEIVTEPPDGPAAPAALVLVLLGALAKAAQVPFHPWLPAAMVAPTPVSAYLHAAAMVKAGVYLVARLAPGFAETTAWAWLVPVVGVATMVWGGWRALAQTDLKRLLAFGTIAQLGFLVVLVGAGTRTAALAGLTLLLAHALFKGCLFMVAGLVDHAAGTRDLRSLSGLARHRVLVVAAALACASMVGLPVTLGYLGKEAAFEAFVGRAPADVAVLTGLVVGSVLTVAYTARFLWGAFAERPGVDPPARAPDRLGTGVAVGLGATGVVLGLLPGAVDELVRTSAAALPGEGEAYELALWHGVGPPLLLSALTLVLGVVLHVGRGRLERARHALRGGRDRAPELAEGAQDRLGRGVAALARAVTDRPHDGHLPRYLAVVLLTVVAVPLLGALLDPAGPGGSGPPLRLWDTPAQLLVAVPLAVAVVGTVVTSRRLVAVLLLSVAGYLVAALFVVHGAPDLALVQVLVETLTLVVVVLVLRRLSATTPHRPLLPRLARVAVSVVVGAGATAVVLLTTAEHAPSRVAEGYLEGAAAAGGTNVVNVVVTEFRALDTLAETTVLAVAATGVASLVLVTRRTGRAPAPGRRRP